MDWNAIILAIIGLAAVGGTFLAFRIHSARRDTAKIKQKNISTGGGNIINGNDNKIGK